MSILVLLLVLFALLNWLIWDVFRSEFYTSRLSACVYNLMLCLFVLLHLSKCENEQINDDDDDDDDEFILQTCIPN